MSEQNDRSESTGPLPPFAGPARRNTSRGGWGPLLPTLLSAAGGVAALWLLENQTSAVSKSARAARDTADDLWHDAHSWADDAGGRVRHWIGETGDAASDRAAHLREGAGRVGGRIRADGHDTILSLGAKAAGLVGVLKALGSGRLSGGASSAAKLMAYTKLADYAASAARSVAQSSAAGRAREVGYEGADRMRDAYRVLRSGRKAIEPERSGLSGVAATGLALVGLGLGAAYLFGSGQGAQRRRNLTNRARAVARGAGDLGTRARAALSDDELVNRVRERVETILQGGAERLRVVAREGRVTLSGLADSAGDVARRAAEAVPGVREVLMGADDAGDAADEPADAGGAAEAPDRQNAGKPGANAAKPSAGGNGRENAKGRKKS